MNRYPSPVRRPLLLALALGACAALPTGAARADDLAGVVARAREQVESGAYADAMKTLSSLPAAGVPPALATEAALLETTAALVAGGPEAGEAACAKAVVASGYDPEVARDQSPKVRAACRAAAAKERSKRVERAKITLSELRVEAPEVAWQPVRISATARGPAGGDAGAPAIPPWLRVVARVSSSALEGSFDLALAPSLEGPLRGTLDPSWIRPRAKIRVELVALDRFGDLGPMGQSRALEVPASEAMVVLGAVPASAKVTIDGASVKPGAGGRAPVSPGRHEVTMELTDGAFARASVDVARGSAARIALSPQRPERSRALAWIATGTAVALGATGGALLFSADSRRNEIEELSARREEGSNLPATEYSELQSKDEDRRTFATAGTALLIAGGVAGAAAVTLWLWPDSGGAKSDKAAGARVWVRGGLSGASVGGVF
ncbi:MAG: hypothetical protein IT372_11000 [Polyangiaceae bacterium]|nr:hypothetical protein [Polyangiaceae bacterium]